MGLFAARLVAVVAALLGSALIIAARAAAGGGTPATPRETVAATPAMQRETVALVVVAVAAVGLAALEILLGRLWPRALTLLAAGDERRQPLDILVIRGLMRGLGGGMVRLLAHREGLLVAHR